MFVNIEGQFDSTKAMNFFIWHQIGDSNYHLSTLQQLKRAQQEISDPEDILILYKFKEENLKLAKKIISELNKVNNDLDMPDSGKLAS